MSPRRGLHTLLVFGLSAELGCVDARSTLEQEQEQEPVAAGADGRGTDDAALSPSGVDAAVGLANDASTMASKANEAHAAGSAAPTATAGAGAARDSHVDAGQPRQASRRIETPHIAVSAPHVTDSARNDVVFEPAGGGFSGAIELRLHASAQNAVIHYTLDGSMPDAQSAIYSAPIHITKTSLVRALSVSDAGVSHVTNQAYLSLADDALGFSSNLPLLVVHMAGAAAPAAARTGHVAALFASFEPNASRSQLQRAATLTSRLGIKTRGRSTRTQPKHSYTIELRGDADDDLPAPLLGMPSDGDWVLYAPYTFDTSLVRDALMYELSNRIGRYAAHTRFCELFLVSGHDELRASDYMGVYVLTERLTRGHQRIDIEHLKHSQVNDPERSGGYIFKIDTPDVPDEAFMVDDQPFVYVDPDYDEIMPQQASYLSDFLGSWRHAIAAKNGVDPRDGTPYQALMDSASFIDHHILNMLGKNPDAFIVSAYYFKDRAGLLNAGPIWDFDLTLGNPGDTWGERSVLPEHWGPGATDFLFDRTPYGWLFQHPEFASAYWQRWSELLAQTLTPATIHELLTSYREQLSEAEPRNTARWPEAAPRYGSFEAELNMLEAWIDARLRWIEQQVEAAH